MASATHTSMYYLLFISRFNKGVVTGVNNKAVVFKVSDNLF